MVKLEGQTSPDIQFEHSIYVYKLQQVNTLARMLAKDREKNVSENRPG